MNKNMQKIMGALARIRDLDNWPESLEKVMLIQERDRDRLSRLDLVQKRQNLGFNMPLSEMFFDPLGNPINRFEYVNAGQFDFRAVERTILGGVTISTVWLCLSLELRDCKPLIFETMIFDCAPFYGYQERYATLAEAEDGHLKAVALVEDHIKKDKGEE